MGHSIGNINSRTLGIIALLLVGALVAVYVFDVSWNTIGTIAFVGFFAWMHMGMHGSHGGHGMHGGHGDDARRDADPHAGHTVDSTSDGNAKTIAADSNARGIATDDKTKSVAREQSHRKHGC